MTLRTDFCDKPSPHPAHGQCAGVDLPFIGGASSVQPMPSPYAARRKPTVEEAEAILLLVRGGWLTLSLALDD